jgi:hypothetical protein
VLSTGAERRLPRRRAWPGGTELPAEGSRGARSRSRCGPNDSIEITETLARVPAAQRSVQGETGGCTNGTVLCSSASVRPLPPAPRPQCAPCSRANALAQLRGNRIRVLAKRAPFNSSLVSCSVRYTAGRDHDAGTSKSPTMAKTACSNSAMKTCSWSNDA